MSPRPASLITGLDPQALFALSADEASPVAWEPPSLEEVARLFPQWEARRLLGRGGMGAVYEMRQPELDRLVAVKLLPIEASRDEHLVERFRREARTLAKLRHPGIVALLEAGISPAGHFFFVMEHVDGSPLSQLIADGKLDAAKAIEIVRQVCEALAFAHAQGVIHRDIKPSNILIDSSGRAKVADFGLARLEQAQAAGALDVSRTGQFMGTPDYAAPEQVKDAAHVDHRADIYSLGVLLYEMLTGDLPRGVFQPPSRKAGSDTRLDDVVRRAMQERPEDRYQAAAELQKDIAPKAKTSGVWFVLFLIAAAVVVWALQNGTDRTDATNRAKVTETKELAVLPQKGKETEEPKQTEPRKAPSMVPQSASTVAAPVPPAASSTVHVWSIEPVSPALQPPTALTKQAWKDAVLTSSGGAVLHPDGSISMWHEARPNAVQRHDLHATALASSGDEVYALDLEGRLIRLSDSKTVTTAVKAIFSYSRPGILPVVFSDGGVSMLDTTSGVGVPLQTPPGDILRLTQLPDGVTWCLLQSGGVFHLEGDSFVKSADSSMQRAADLFAGDGFTAVLDENGRCTLHGPKVPEGRQVFRLPAGAKNLRVGPQGRMVAW